MTAHEAALAAREAARVALMLPERVILNKAEGIEPPPVRRRRRKRSPATAEDQAAPIAGRPLILTKDAP